MNEKCERCSGRATYRLAAEGGKTGLACDVHQITVMANLGRPGLATTVTTTRIGS